MLVMSHMNAMKWTGVTVQRKKQYGREQSNISQTNRYYQAPQSMVVYSSQCNGKVHILLPIEV